MKTMRLNESGGDELARRLGLAPRLDGRTVVVQGCRGLALVRALEIAREGARIVITGADARELSVGHAMLERAGAEVLACTEPQALAGASAATGSLTFA